MQKVKYRYFIDNKEVETREDYLNSTMSGDYFTYFDGSSVFSFSFGEIERLALKDAIEFNEAVKQYLEKLPETEKWVNDKIKKDLIYIKNKEETNDTVKNGYFYFESEEGRAFTFDINKPPTEMYTTGILDSGQIKGNSTRHKAREQGKYHVEKEPDRHLTDALRYRLELSKKSIEEYKSLFERCSAQCLCDGICKKSQENNPLREKQNPMEHLDEVLERIEKTELGEKVYYGTKESEGKLYYELSWEFIEEMAKRMANHKKDKYPLYNWKKPMTPKGVDDLIQGINRHHIEVMKGNYKDGDEILGHIVSYACNSMILWEQLKNNTNNLEVKK